MENQNTDYKQPEERLPENDLPQDVEDSSRQKKELDQEIHSTESKYFSNSVSSYLFSRWQQPEYWAREHC